MSLLALEGLHVSYGGIRAVKGVDLAVESGELVCLIGANGAGKTTTLRAITGLVKAAGGRVVYDGEDIAPLRVHEIARRGLALVPEGRGVFAQLTIEENLAMGAYARADRAAIAADVERAFTLFPRLKERRRQTAGTLSGGEQQMLAMARILRTGANLLLLDEITEGLAPVIVQALGRVIVKLKERGFTIVLVEQNFRFAAPLADRHYIIEHGRVAESFTAAELESKTGMLHEYLGA